MQACMGEFMHGVHNRASKCLLESVWRSVQTDFSPDTPHLGCAMWRRSSVLEGERSAQESISTDVW